MDKVMDKVVDKVVDSIIVDLNCYHPRMLLSKDSDYYHRRFWLYGCESVSQWERW